MSESGCGGPTDSKTDSDKDSSVCPTCGKDDFSSRQYMKAHHKIIHGESIAGVEYDCDNCGKVMRRRPSRIENHDFLFCSDECRDTHSELHEKIAKTFSENWEPPTGEDHPNYNSQQVECENCGKELVRSEWRINSFENQFCSDPCRGEWFSENVRGENHPLYKKEKVREYGPNWDEKAERCRERDDYKCQSCGKDQSDHHGKLIAHHITPREDFIVNGVYDHERGDRLENLVTLCRGCHQKWEGLYVKPQLL